MSEKWYESMGPDGDVVVSTRVRLARNLAEYPFPGHMTHEQEQKVLQAVSEAMTRSAGGSEFSFTNMDDIPELSAQAMVERHLISPELAHGSAARGVVLSRDESVSVMINEEDHIRIQVLGAGLCLDDCWKKAAQVDALLEDSFKFAFSERLGYLTHCPTNLGTGLRASVMLHLPALTSSGEIRKLIAASNKLGFAVRGVYGEGSTAAGDLYQVSNQLTLGLNEEETMQRLTDAVQRFIEAEKKLREQLRGRGAEEYEDRAWRAAGILSSARLIDSREAAEKLSELRLGVSMGFISGIAADELNRLSWEIQPACLSLANGGELTARDRDIKRAELLRSAVKGVIGA